MGGGVGLEEVEEVVGDGGGGVGEGVMGVGR